MTQRLYGILGDPVGQARSPSVFNARFAAEGRDAVMIPIEVAAADVAAALSGLRKMRNFAGLVVTVPHKAAAAAIARRRSTRVDLVRAANVLRPIAGGWEAELFDGEGFINGLRGKGHQVKGKAVAIVGAGGAGVAIAEAVLAAGATVSLSDRDIYRADATIDLLNRAFPGCVSLGPPGPMHAIAVNATPAGMDGDQSLSFDPADLDKRALVAEVVMKPAVTPLLRRAAELGLATHEGRYMLDGQADAIWSFLRMGEDIPATQTAPVR